MADVTLKGHLQKASRLAIFGPKHLAFVFSSSYHFGKQYCEQPEKKLKIEQILLQVVGQPVQVSFTLEQDREEASVRQGTHSETSTTPKTTSSSQKVPSLEEIADPFVHEVAELFQATPVKKEDIPIPKSPEES